MSRIIALQKGIAEHAKTHPPVLYSRQSGRSSLATSLFIGFVGYSKLWQYRNEFFSMNSSRFVLNTKCFFEVGETIGNLIQWPDGDEALLTLFSNIRRTVWRILCGSSSLQNPCQCHPRQIQGGLDFTSAPFNRVTALNDRTTV